MLNRSTCLLITIITIPFRGSAEFGLRRTMLPNAVPRWVSPGIGVAALHARRSWSTGDDGGER
jgi:hypothetical protein